MFQISKCPRVTLVLSYWEASGEVSKLSYKSLLFDTSRRSYCSSVRSSLQIFRFSLSRLLQAKATTVPLNFFKIQIFYTKPNGFYNTSKSINQSNGAKGTHLPKKIYMLEKVCMFLSTNIASSPTTSD